MAEEAVARLARELAEAQKRVAELEEIVAENRKITGELARLATFPEQNPNIVIETTTGGEILYLNPDASHRFPDMLRLGFQHPLLAGFSEVISTFLDGRHDYLAREVSVGRDQFEIKYCFLPTERLVHIYATDITGRKQAEEEIKNLARELRLLTRQIVQAQEEERRRVAHELHDDTGQALVALKISLDLLYKRLPTDAAELSDDLASAIELVDETRNRIRRIARGLRPPKLDTVGLNPALQRVCRDFSQRTQLEIRYDGVDLPLLPETVSISLYRILQEALTNVAKHAGAHMVSVSLSTDAEEIRLLIEDDGVGLVEEFDASSPKRPDSLGFLGMRERLELLGGVLEVKSRATQGTRLVARIPVED